MWLMSSAPSFLALVSLNSLFIICRIYCKKWRCTGPTWSTPLLIAPLSGEFWAIMNPETRWEPLERVLRGTVGNTDDRGQNPSSELRGVSNLQSGTNSPVRPFLVPPSPQCIESEGKWNLLYKPVFNLVFHSLLCFKTFLYWGLNNLHILGAVPPDQLCERVVLTEIVLVSWNISRKKKTQFRRWGLP